MEHFVLQDNGMQITDLKYLHIDNAIKVFDLPNYVFQA